MSPGYPVDANAMGSLKADVAVIGSGPGGAVAALRCAEAGLKVIMIEEGQHRMLDSAPHFSRDEILQKYRNAGIEVALSKTKLSFVEGRCVGGGSEINRGLYHRTPDYVLEDWSRKYGVAGLTVETLGPHFEACEKIALVEYLPGKAPWISTKLQEGGQALGWNAIEAPRLFHYASGRNGGRKQSMTETFVPRFLKAGGRLLPDMRARKVLRAGKSWTIQAVHGSVSAKQQATEIRAERVFVACGAVQTPALLRRSGIRSNVGNTLRFHPMIKLVAEFDDEVNLPGDLDPVHQIKEFEPRFSMGCSISKPEILGLALANHSGHFRHVAENWKRMGIYYVQTGGGIASVRNLPGFNDPLIRINFSNEDLRTFAEGMKRLAEALFAAGARRIFPSVPGLPILKNVDQLRTLPELFTGGDGSLTSVHVFSSCPMGENAALTATDSYGRVHGTDGLYISDASLLCEPTVVNPQGTVMAVCHRNVMHALAHSFH
jgi:choline dehydrogenase-like flavoprotein